MPRYQVLITRDCTESQTVYVDAESVEEANEKATDAEYDQGEWEQDDYTDGDVYVPDPDATEEVSYQVWFAGSNMPGYLPDTPPHPFADALDARASAIEDLLRYAEDSEGDYSEAERTVAELRESNESEFNAYFGDYVFWVSRDTMTHSDLLAIDGVDSTDDYKVAQ